MKRPRILVYAHRDWSFENLKPVLENGSFEYIRVQGAQLPKDFDVEYDLIATCEPHIGLWTSLWPDVKDKIKVIALQQSLYWSETKNANASWPFHMFMLWGHQMLNVSRMYPSLSKKVVVTGNPRWDQFFEMVTEDKGYTLILGSGGERSMSGYPKFSGKVIFQAHPNMRNDKMPLDTESLVRSCSKCVFRSTGAGIMPMILRKPVMILPPLANEPWGLSFRKSKLYNSGTFGVDLEFVEWAIGGPGATERVTNLLLNPEFAEWALNNL